MTIEINHLYIQAGDPLLAPSTFLEKPGTLIFPSSLKLNEYCYAILKPGSSVERIVGSLSTLLMVMHCSETKRTAVILAGPRFAVSKQYTDPVDELIAGEKGSIEIRYLQQPGSNSGDIVPLVELLAEHKNVVPRSFEGALTEGAELFSVDRDTGNLKLYHPTPSVPSLSLASADSFTTLFDLLVKLEISVKGPEFEEFGLWIQHDGYQSCRLPVISDTPRVYIQASRPPIAADDDDGGFPPFPFTEVFGMKMAVGVHAAIKMFRENRGAGGAGLLTAERLVELGLYCAVCGKQEGLMKCSGCKREYYCGQAHQTEDWVAHARWCKQLRNKNIWKKN
ncbi:hypothetical protein BCR35DRAFT_330615 [Leucosporidium creatinivorum]|uniref:MYND-type domain-containing protein n=1 Tax=Leucosporidium creatinivorum TaxID=106004 RepID=A0A1Y2FT15_9BASI|nr:hypothetical protein BCR35DRAFT_330615 [Leucosporidium creatinivorum]